VEGTGVIAAQGRSGGEAERLRLGYPKAEHGYEWRLRNGQLEYRSTDLEKFPKRRYNESTKEFESAPERRDTDDRIDEHGTEREALDLLGAYDYELDPTSGERTPTSEFRKFIELLLGEGIIGKPEDLFDPKTRGDGKERIKPGGLTERTVRHNLKKPFIDKLLARTLDAARLKKLASYKTALEATKDPAPALRAASHEEMLRISDGLPNADRGSFGDRWFGEQYAKDSAGQVPIDRSKYPDLRAPKRVIDRVQDDGSAKEIKNVTDTI